MLALGGGVLFMELPEGLELLLRVPRNVSTAGETLRYVLGCCGVTQCSHCLGGGVEILFRVPLKTCSPPGGGGLKGLSF